MNRTMASPPYPGCDVSDGRVFSRDKRDFKQLICQKKGCPHRDDGDSLSA